MGEVTVNSGGTYCFVGCTITCVGACALEPTPFLDVAIANVGIASCFDLGD